jgi:glutathione-regulated potassium-efflux system ancillary protein KefC
MDFIWIFIAFLFGLGIKLLSLPPMIGYMLAGFILHYWGVEPESSLNALADIGITLMLFTIGLKLNISDLLKREVWFSSLSHMSLWVLIIAGVGVLISLISLALVSGANLITAAVIAFALSFSSTVCIIKLLEETGEMKTRHGKLAIGVLVIQDVIAVAFLAMATGKIPSPWALALFLLIPFRKPIGKLLKHSGHGELLPLTGFFLALGAYELFELVGVKGDLGALVIGALLSGHKKAAELSKSLLSFKDIFLIGFFLTIGFTAIPDLQMLLTAFLISLLLPLKFLLFFFIFTGLKLRGRTAYLSALALSNFSEFGLIVAALSVENAWIEKEWLVILALAVSMSFVYTNILYHSAHRFYGKHKHKIRKYESPNCLSEDLICQPENAEILIIGLGRVGKGAYASLYETKGNLVWGIDVDRDKVLELSKQGINAFTGDGEDADLWENINLEPVKLILLALPSIDDDINILQQLKQANFQGKVAAIARYEDERKKLIEAGINNVFNFYKEAGIGFAEESLEIIRTN